MRFIDFITKLGGGGVADPTLILDTFTAADGTNINGRTPLPTNTPGNNWSVLSGGWTIEGNKAQAGVAITNNVMVINAGVADGTITVDLTTPASGAFSLAVIVRRTDASNQWLIRLTPTEFDILEINAGAANVRATVTVTNSASTTYAIRVILSGQTITATRDGANQISYGSASLNQAVTTHGIREGAQLASRADNFKFTP